MDENSAIQISLAAARVNAGMTQEEVANAMNVGKQTVCNWENGKVELKISQARALSSLYKMPLRFIVMPTKSN